MMYRSETKQPWSTHSGQTAPKGETLCAFLLGNPDFIGGTSGG